MRKPFLHPVRVDSVTALTEESELYTATKTIQIIQEDQEDFFFFYNYLNAFINETTSMADIKVLNWITLNLSYNSDEIVLNKKNKEKIKEYTGLSYSAVERSIGVLAKANIIVRDNNFPRAAIYFVNSTYVWKGDRTERKKSLKFVLEVIQTNQLSDYELKIEEDIKRYEKWYKESNQDLKPERNKKYGVKL